MNHRFLWPLVASFVALPVFATAAGERVAGASLTYEIVQTNKIDAGGALANVPAFARGQAAANLAAGQKPQTTVLTIVADRVEADGSAHVNATFTNSVEQASVAAKALAARNTFEATLASDGRILPVYDPAMQMTFDAHGMSPDAQVHNLHAGRFQQMLADFNAFVTGCAKRGKLVAGDTWRVQLADAYGISRTFEFAAKGTESAHGHDAALVTMSSRSEGSGSTWKVDAGGHYDPAQRLVVDLHDETTFSNASPSGNTLSSGTTTTDITLR